MVLHARKGRSVTQFFAEHGTNTFMNPVNFLADRTIGRAFGTVCRLSSVTFCIMAKRYVLAKNCVKERIGNQGQKVDFLGRRHISTFDFALFLPVQPSDR